jgi:shikimate dehydrogenase
MAIRKAKAGSEILLRKFGLIGFPLTHSFSKKYFDQKFRDKNILNSSYQLFEIKTVEDLIPILNSNPELSGLNVTIPYKESVIKYLDELDATAEAIGAINCIKIIEGRLKGFNTDVFGFEVSLKKFVTEIPDQIFVLGTGGSSKAVCFVLKAMNLPFIKVSRKSTPNCALYEEVESLMKQSNLFINTTPLGMFPEVDQAPQIPFVKLSERDFLFDLIYNPEETLFLKRGKEGEAKTQNGLEMLQLQAEKSWEIWNS